MRVLPVMTAIGHMLQSVLENLGNALRLQWPWLIVFTVLTYVLFMMAPSAGLRIEPGQRPTPEQITAIFGAVIPYFLVLMLGFSSMAVTWHNYILRDEKPNGLALLRLDGAVFRYFGNFFLLILMMTVVVLPGAIISTVLGSAGVLLLLAYIIIVMLPIVYRLSIKFPAIALGRRDFRFGDAWNASQNNWWQIVGLAILLSLLGLLGGAVSNLVAYVLTAALGASVGGIIGFIVEMIVQWFFMVLGIATLTSLYGFFVEQRDF